MAKSFVQIMTNCGVVSRIFGVIITLNVHIHQIRWFIIIFIHASMLLAMQIDESCLETEEKI